MSSENPGDSGQEHHGMHMVKEEEYTENRGDEQGMEILDEEEVEDEEIIDGGEINEADLIENGGDIQIEYVADDGTVVGAEEVVMEDGILMEEADIATESLVALSRGQCNKDKSVREFIQQTVPLTGKLPRPSPRILRRPLPSPGDHSGNNRNYGGNGPPQTERKPPNYPVPSQTKRLLPVATLPTNNQKAQKQKDWREEQRRLLEIYEIYDYLPDHMKEPFKRVVEMGGTKADLPAVRQQYTRRSAGNNRMPAGGDRSSQYGMMDEGHGGRRQTAEYKDHRDRSFGDQESESSRYGNNSSRVVVLNREGKKGRDGEEVLEPDDGVMDGSREIEEDMPQLEEAPVTPGLAPPPPTETQIDVEGYDSGDDPDIRNGAQMDIRNGAQLEYVIDGEELVEDDMYDRDPKESNFDRHLRSSHIIMPNMREEFFGTVDMREYSANQIMVNQQIPESRFCPGCKMNLKRSVYYHHSRMIKKYGACNMFTPKRFPCGFDGCEDRLGTVEKLCEHMWQIHGSPTEIKTEIFHSEAEFEVFLRELEGKGGNFRMSRGNKMIKAGLVQYFRCNRMQSVSREKTTRNCDEIGLFGDAPVKPHVRHSDDDPFAGQTGKPCIRTEEACTAFFRKAYLPNNTIEVRYCDHHLHEDERVRLPPVLKDRIYEMHRKHLPAPVIMMVLQGEKDKYCTPGSATERRILAMTPKDIATALSTRPNARKLRRDNEIEEGAEMERQQREHQRNAYQQGQEVDDGCDSPATASSSRETVAISMDRQIPGVAAMEEVLEEVDEHEMGNNQMKSTAQHNQPVGQLRPPVVRGVRRDLHVPVNDQLTELEQQMLDAYEANHDVILTDMQRIKRMETKKKHQRELIRNRVFALGRFIKTMSFAEMPVEKLEEMEDALRMVTGVTRSKLHLDAFPLSIPSIKEENRQYDAEGREYRNAGGGRRETAREYAEMGGGRPVEEVDFEQLEEDPRPRRPQMAQVKVEQDAPMHAAQSPRARRKRKLQEESVHVEVEQLQDDEEEGNNQQMEQEQIANVVNVEGQQSVGSQSEVMEHIVVEENAAGQSLTGSQAGSPKKTPGRRGRPRKEVKKEVPDEELPVNQEVIDQPPPPVNKPVVQLPSRTRTGRVVRPRTIVDV